MIAGFILGEEKERVRFDDPCTCRREERSEIEIGNFGNGGGGGGD